MHQWSDRERAPEVKPLEHVLVVVVVLLVVNGTAAHLFTLDSYTLWVANQRC